MNKLILFATALVALSGCSSVNVYQPYKAAQETGYYSTKHGDGFYQVVFKGHAGTETAQIYDFALLRAAEVTKENNATCFVVIFREDDWSPKERTESIVTYPNQTPNTPNYFIDPSPRIPTSADIKPYTQPNSDQGRFYQDQFRASRPPGPEAGQVAWAAGVRESAYNTAPLPPFQTSNIPSSPIDRAFMPPTTSTPASVPSPSSRLLIYTFQTRPRTSHKVYAADEVIAELRAKYKLNK